MKKSTIRHVKKRDGRVVKFTQDKITNAIFKVTHAVGDADEKLAERLSTKVVKVLSKKFADSTPTVEQIQDTVESVLMDEHQQELAKAYILYRERRKEIREAKSLLGVKDDVKLSVNAISILERRYLRKNEEGNVVETPGQMFRRVAANIASAEKKHKKTAKEIKVIEREFFNVMSRLEFLPNSPTLMNAGTNIQQLSACFVLPVEDTMESIFEAVKNTSLIHQSGGGTGFSFSRLRPKGDLVKSTGGVASGPLSFMNVFNAATEVVKQGGKRRGANMAILRIDHPDCTDFIVAKEKEGMLNNFNISVGLTDAFMESILTDANYDLINPRNGKVAGSLNAQHVFDLIVTMAWKNGEPGIVFLDRLNRDNPTPQIGEIESTNPCVVGNTLVPTEDGLQKIDDMARQYRNHGTDICTDIRVPIISSSKDGQLLMTSQSLGVEMNTATKVWQSGIKETLKLITKSGFELIATPDHKIMTSEGWVELRRLAKEHKILIQSGAGKFNNNPNLPFAVDREFQGKNGRTYRFNFPTMWSKELGQTLGWLVGDGWLREGDENCRVGFVFSKDDGKIMRCIKPFINSMYGKDIREVMRENNTFHLSYHSKYFVDFFKKLGVCNVMAADKKVPKSIYTSTKDAVVGFLQGLFTADGTVNIVKGKSAYIRLTSKSRELLRGVQPLLLNLGIMSKIYDRSRAPRENMFSYVDKEGVVRQYTVDGTCYELEISKDNVIRFLDNVGFLCDKHEKKVSLLRCKAYYKHSFVDDVFLVMPNGQEQVYDLTEPRTHSFIANGIVVSNCGEQPLLPYESCNLGSINMSKMLKQVNEDYEIDWKKLKKTVHTAVRFLDDVIQTNKYPLDDIKKMTRGNRKIGLGVMGFSDMLIRLGIPYNSVKAVETAEDIMGFIQTEGRKMSVELAEKRGPFPNWKGSIYHKKMKIRNATITTIAPTGTISIIANCSSGIEPLFAISYIRKTPQFEFVEVNSVFEEIARKGGFYSEKLMQTIAGRGSIQDIADIPEDVRRVFVTAHDITPEDHVRIQAAFQKYTDNAVSKTVNFPNNATTKEVEEVYLLAYKLGCKGVTIYRDKSREEQVLNIETPTPKKEHVVKGNERMTAKKSGSCPECKSNLVYEEGCAKCPACGYSVCTV